MTPAEFVAVSLGGFITDPASSDHQRGFLSAMIQVAEVVGTPVSDELKAQLVKPEPTKDAIAELRESIGKVMDERNKNLGRNPKHKRTKDAELEFVIGIGHGMHISDHPLKQMGINWAFLMSVGRDPFRS